MTFTNIKSNAKATKLLWMAVAAIAIALATIFLWLHHYSTAFVIAALGLVSWFLNYRVQMKALVTSAEREQRESEELDEDE